EAGPNWKALGVSVTLPDDKRLTLADGDTKVELEVDASWVTSDVQPGLGVFVLAGPTSANLQLVPSVSVAGLGLRFTKKGGPLVSLGPVSLDGIAVHVYGEVQMVGAGVEAGGGVNLELSGLS